MRGIARIFAVAALAVALAQAGPPSGRAESGPRQTEMRELDTVDEARGWAAVGRINIGRIGYCTGALITPELVLTAAHCLYDSRTGKLVPLDDFEFAAGLRNGRAEAYRSVRRTAAHPEYVYNNSDEIDRVAYDIALLQLDKPIRHPSITPFVTAARPGRGQPVSIVSYATGRDDAPSLQEVCEILGRRRSVLVLSCEVDFGASGSPVFLLDGGEVRIVSVVSAKAMIDERRVALAAELGTTLDEVRAVLEAPGGLLTNVPPPLAERPTTGAAGSAKFVRP